MGYMIGGAAIFAIGAFFGAMIYAAGQQSKANNGSQRFWDAAAKSLEKNSK